MPLPDISGMARAPSSGQMGNNYDVKPYEDRAIIRYRSDGSLDVNVLNETAFMNEITKHQRINDKYWETVEIIQTCIKSKIGIGEPIFINFYAPMDENNPDAEIDYEYKDRLPSDRDLIATGQEELYCYK